jgi:hypothetical protein
MVLLHVDFMTTFSIVLSKFITHNINDQHPCHFSDFGHRKVFNAEIVGMCMIYAHVRFQVRIASGSLVVIVELKLNINFMQPPFCFLTFYERKDLKEN